VCLNTVDNVEQFLQDINQGRWDAVLPQITHLRLPTEKLYDLYEQIVCEMIEMRETDTARAMLRTMKAFKRLQQDDAERYMRLDRLTNPCESLLFMLTIEIAKRSALSNARIANV
jgi:WD40 repeat-containing protein SMU1